MLELLVGQRFTLVLLGYYGLTWAYSLRLERAPLVDVITLAGLYTVRIIAGAAATAIPLSFWLLAFSVFIFDLTSFAHFGFSVSATSAERTIEGFGRPCPSKSNSLSTKVRSHIAGLRTGFQSMTVGKEESSAGMLGAMN